MGIMTNPITNKIMMTNQRTNQISNLMRRKKRSCTIQKKMKSTSKVKSIRGKHGIRKEFLENEAELSGSEASDDEEKRGLDKLLAEEGDLDDIDADVVRDEVGRIHHRQQLDEDKREIRLFQEAFLEDGELHSDNTRNRKFRWKNVDDDQIDLTLRNSDEEAEEEISEQDEKRRQERLEREKWIQENEEKEQKKKKVARVTKDEEEEDHNDSQFFNMASKALKKLKRRTSMNETSSTNPQPAQLQQKIFKSPKAAKPLQILSGNQKGSFLSRESGTLEKLAEMTRGKSEAKTGSTAKNTNNFVFAAVSPPPKSGNNNEQVQTGGTENQKQKQGKKNKSKSNQHHQSGPAQKRARVDRTLTNENSSTTIFGLLD